MSCCGSGGGCGGGGCAEKKDKSAGCGGCSGGGGSGCGGCPKRPIALLAFPRAALSMLVTLAGEGSSVALIDDPALGIKVVSRGQEVVAERIDFTSPIDPLTGWTYEAANKTPATGLITPPRKELGTVPTENLEAMVEFTHDPYPAFAALVRVPQTGGFTLKPQAYQKETPAEMKRWESLPEAWPPAEAAIGTGALPHFAGSAFNVDQVSFACEQTHGRPFLYSGKRAEVGQGLYVHMDLVPVAGVSPGEDDDTFSPFARFTGVITAVGDLPLAPPAGTPGVVVADAVVGKSFFDSCQCGKEHPREEVLNELGTLHGQRIQAVLFLTPEFAGRVPHVAGQWDAVLIADDSKQFIWQLLEMRPRPRASWVPRS